MATAGKLTLWFIAIAFLAALNTPLWPPTFWDRVWAWVVICVFPVGAFFAARGARSGIPFILYAGIAAGLYTLGDWLDAASIRGYGMSHEWIIRGNLQRSAGLIVSCRLAASLRWWIARRRERPKEPRCAKCGYLLIGLPEPRCPECGTPFDETALRAKDVDGTGGE